VNKKETFTKEAIDDAEVRFKLAEDLDMQDVRCALDFMLKREVIASKKASRLPEFHTRALYDELIGFVFAGHDTSSATFDWTLKLLSDNQRVQKRLRLSLRDAFPRAMTDDRLPSAEEITTTSIPYLDAVQEEIFRTSLTSPSTVRTTRMDTTVLGHVIPKGTEVFLLQNGASFLEPAFDIPESRRSDSSRNAKEKIGRWDGSDVMHFEPERWLVKNEAQGGKETFRPIAGPQMLFGAGPRGCFGRRLAYMQLRFMIVMVVWSFELEYAGDNLSTYRAEDGVTHRPKQCFVKLKVIA